MFYGGKSTLACAFSGVAVETDGAELARMSGCACFAFKALPSHSVAPVSWAHFVVVAAVAPLTETAGQEGITEETFRTPVAFDESEIMLMNISSENGGKTSSSPILDKIWIEFLTQTVPQDR